MAFKLRVLDVSEDIGREEALITCSHQRTVGVGMHLPVAREVALQLTRQMQGDAVEKWKHEGPQRIHEACQPVGGRDMEERTIDHERNRLT